MNKKRLTIIIICFVLVISAMTACKKKNDDQVDSGVVSVTPEVTQTVTPTVQPEDDVTVEPEVTPEPNEDTTESENYISYEEAIRNIQNIIGERGYVIELLDDHLNVGDSTYYIFQISDSSSVIEPNVIVDKVSGELLCYNSDGTTEPFTEFPLYTEPVVDNGENNNSEDSFTKEDALDKLSKVDLDTLGLTEKLSEYTIVYDDWTTYIQGVECYGINVFSEVDGNRNNMGLFYVAVDGSEMYKFDSIFDDFVKIEE